VFLKKVMIGILALGILGGPAFSKEQGRNFTIGPKRIVKSVKNLLKEGTLDSRKTCLDEYMNRHRQLAKMLGLGPLGGLAGTAGTAAAGVGAGAVSGVLIGSPIVLAGVGGVVGGAVGVAGLVGYQIYSLTAFLQNRYLIKVISNARDGEGKSLKRFTKSVSRKLKGHRISQESVADLIIEADKSGALCDGSLVRKSKKRKLTKLRHHLVNKRELIKHLKLTL
jgi:hypothetical protein